MSTWRKLESARIVRPHATSREEIEVQFAAVDRNLRDADIHDVSADNRFSMAYGAARRLATIALFASGYEPHGDDHHKNTFQALPVAMGDTVTMLADYLDRCRRKRSNIDYDAVDIATESEAAELCKKVRAFRQQVLDWLLKNHPALCPAPAAPEPSE